MYNAFHVSLLKKFNGHGLPPLSPPPLPTMQDRAATLEPEKVSVKSSESTLILSFHALCHESRHSGTSSDVASASFRIYDNLCSYELHIRSTPSSMVQEMDDPIVGKKIKRKSSK